VAAGGERYPKCSRSTYSKLSQGYRLVLSLKAVAISDSRYRDGFDMIEL
jgi:hypothetical protein